MRDDDLRTVTDGLKWLIFKLDGRSAARLYDLHVVSEDSVKDLLNCLRSLDLENLNKNGINFPAIDLGDKGRRLSFQITSEKTAAKIQRSLDTFHKHNLDTDYDHVFFLILGKKQKKYSSVKSTRISFDPTRHVIDIDDVIDEASKLHDAQLTKLAEIIKAAGLQVSKPQDSDEDGVRKICAHFDRDALKHRWHQEGSIAGFETALNDLSELLGKGSVRGQPITKPVYQFAPELDKDLNAIKDALGELRALFNASVNSGEIRRDQQFAYFSNPARASQINVAKQKIIDAVNQLGSRFQLRPMRMNEWP